MNQELSLVADLLGDSGRAAILLSLMGGVSRPAGELASIARVAPQTASEHLARLVKGRLLHAEKHGRHRFYRLASEEVANAVEALLVLTQHSRQTARVSSAPGAAPGTLTYARTCYAHLAGWLGVRIADALLERKLLKPSGPKNYLLTPAGADWFQQLGLKITPNDTTQFARRCLDWTERRHHIAGQLGCSLFEHFKEQKWLARIGTTRCVRVTLEGKHKLWQLLRIPVT